MTNNTLSLVRINATAVLEVVSSALPHNSMNTAIVVAQLRQQRTNYACLRQAIQLLELTVESKVCMHVPTLTSANN